MVIHENVTKNLFYKRIHISFGDIYTFKTDLTLI